MFPSPRVLSCTSRQRIILGYGRNVSSLSCHASVCTRSVSPFDDESETLPHSHTSTAQVATATYAILLRACGNDKALQDGMLAHHHIIVHGLAHDVFLQGLLVQMYGKCGFLDHALELFFAMHERSAHSWNFIIRACAQQGLHHLSLELFYQMQQEGAAPDKFTYVCVFTACAGKGDLHYSMRMHARILESSIELDMAVGTAVVNMYGNCGRMNDAKLNFDKMIEHDVVSWNVMLAIYGQHDEGKQALQLFWHMQQQGYLPTKVTFVTMLEACAVQSELNEGRKTHVCILGSGSKSDAMVENALMNMYGKCGSLHHACISFEQMLLRNVVTWSTMISLCVQYEQIGVAFQLYHQMHQEGVLPERATFLAILAACADSALLPIGEHLIVCLNGIEDNVVMTEVVNMYGRCGSVESARKVFDAMSSHDVVACNTMISVYTQHGEDHKAFQLFEQMLSKDITPTSVTSVSMLGACINVTEGKTLHAYVTENEIETGVILGNAVVSMYGKIGNIGDAWSTFISMARRDVISWNAMIAAYAWNGKIIEALGLFQQMVHEGITPDKVTHITILEAYAHCQMPAIDGLICCMGVDEECTQAGESASIDKLRKPAVLQNACNLFNGLQEPDLRAWNAMIDIYVQQNEGIAAFLLFDKMQWEGVLPNCDSFISILSLCAAQKTLAEGKRIHCSIMEKKLESNFAVGTALVSMYGNHGSVDDARRAFDKFTSKNVVLWTAMISVYTQSWHGDKGLKLLYLMQQCGMVPNKITYISLLGACIGQGALWEGKNLHACISSMGFLSDIVVVTALIDMYSKCGKLEDALLLFHKSPIHDILLWNTMISLCSQHGLAAKALELFDSMEKEGVKPDSVTFISILTACSHCGLIGDAFYWFNIMFPDYDLPTTKAHYVCMIDVLGRAGQLETAWSLASGMPFLPTEVPYMMLLRACQQQADLKYGELAAVHSFELGSGNTAPYVLLSNIHAVGSKRQQLVVF